MPIPNRQEVTSLLHFAWGRVWVPSSKGRRAQAKRALQIAIFIAGFIGFVYLFLRLFYMLQGYLTQPLEGYSFYAYIGVFLVALFSSATVFIPAPGLAFILAAATKWDPALVAVAASLGSSLGEITAYYVGRWGVRLVHVENSAYYQRASQWMHHYGIFAIAFFAFVPFLMFDLAGIGAGALRMPLKTFLLGTYMGRLPRAFLECYLGWGVISWLFPFLSR